MINIEQIVNICTSKVELLKSGDVVLSKLLSRMKPEEKVMFFSVYKVKTLLDIVRSNNTGVTEFENFKHQYTTNSANIDMIDKCQDIVKCLGYIDDCDNRRDAIGAIEYRALSKACYWKEQVTLSILVQLYALIEKDDKNILRILAEYIWSYYNCIYKLFVTELEYRKSVYISVYYDSINVFLQNEKEDK